MRGLIGDLRNAVRLILRSPVFSIVAVGTLALGIGANAAIFALVDRVMLRSLPVADPRALVLLRSPGPTEGHTWNDGDEATSFSYPMYRDLAKTATVFSGLVAEFPFSVSLSASGDTDRAAGELVSGNYFSVLGVGAAAGRTFSAGDDGAPGAHPVAMLSHAFWKRRFGGDASVVGRTVSVNGSPLTLVGIAAEHFTGVQPGRPADIFVPMAMKPQMTPLRNGLDDPKDHWVQILGRLKPGLSRSAAESAVQAVYRPLLVALSPRMTGMDAAKRRQFEARRLFLLPGGHGRLPLQLGVGTPLLSLMGMVALVLLIACSNLAALLAARGAARQREYGIRLAIGASRYQLIRQSIVECLVFAFLGGALGIFVAMGTLHALLSAFPPDADLRQVSAQVDPRVLAFAAFASLVSGLLFGAAPAVRAARLDPARTLQGGGRGTVSAGGDVLRFRRWLVTGQIALTVVLLVAAGLFVGTLRNLARVPLGLAPDHVIGFSVEPRLSGYSVERSAALARRVVEDLANLPGVRSASAAEVATLVGNTVSGSVTVDGVEPSGEESSHVGRNSVGPDYFATLGIPILAGRPFTWRDDAAAPRVALVNEEMARRFFPGRSPIGARIKFNGRGAAKADTEIIGVTRNSKSSDVGEKDAPFAYLPYMQDSNLGELTFYVRSQQDPKGLGPALRAAVKRIDPQLPIFDLKTLPDQISESLVTQRLVVLLSASFGALAALLAAIGIYGVLAFAVAQRRQEIGVRVALGADPASVRRLILGEVGRFLAVGIAIGIPAAYAVGRGVQSILYGVGAANVGVFVAAAALMACVAFVAGYPPARRASRVSAMEALRND